MSLGGVRTYSGGCFASRLPNSGVQYLDSATPTAAASLYWTEKPAPV